MSIKQTDKSKKKVELVNEKFKPKKSTGKIEITSNCSNGLNTNIVYKIFIQEKKDLNLQPLILKITALPKLKLFSFSLYDYIMNYFYIVNNLISKLFLLFFFSIKSRKSLLIIGKLLNLKISKSHNSNFFSMIKISAYSLLIQKDK